MLSFEFTREGRSLQPYRKKTQFQSFQNPSVEKFYVLQKDQSTDCQCCNCEIFGQAVSAAWYRIYKSTSQLSHIGARLAQWPKDNIFGQSENGPF